MTTEIKLYSLCYSILHPVPHKVDMQKQGWVAFDDAIIVEYMSLSKLELFQTHSFISSSALVPLDAFLKACQLLGARGNPFLSSLSLYLFISTYSCL